MTNREKIERLRQEVDIDYAFGITGLLTLADAVDDLIERVNALERRADGSHPIVTHDVIARVNALEHGSDNHRVDATADVLAALADLRRQIAKLTKTVKKRRN
jgi:hypothetical protein